MKNKHAVVLFSGGLDSTTALYWALENFAGVHALNIRYSQRHHIEVEMAEKTARNLGVEYRLIDFPLKDIVYSALIDRDKEIPGSLETSRDEAGVPFTYVPFRNGIFISLAAAYAESRKFFDIVTGFNLIDTPDYPDTTPEFSQKMEAALNQGTSASLLGERFRIHNPLIEKSKQDIIRLGMELNADYAHAVSCYRGGEVPCLACPSCDIRSRAFAALELEDPLITRLKEEGKI